MDWRTSIGHEIGILCWESIHFVIVMGTAKLFGLETLLIWPCLIIVIFISIIQDADAFTESPSIFVQLVRFCTNAVAACFAIVCSGLVCHFTDTDESQQGKKGGMMVSMECDYGTFGLVIIAYLTSLFLLSSIRTVMTGFVLAFKIFRSIWIHFNDPID